MFFARGWRALELVPREGKEEKEKRTEKGKRNGIPRKKEERKERHEPERIAGQPSTEDGIGQRGKDAPKRGAADGITTLQWIACKR